MTIVRRVRRRAGPTLQQRVAQLEQELLTERQLHADDLAAARASSLAFGHALGAAEERVLVLDRTVQGLREQLLEAKRELEDYKRRHGMGDQVRAT